MNNEKMKHLEMIQAIINRMANNSFLLKGWAVTLITGILALSYNSKVCEESFVTYIPILMFWFLDSYYLQQERLFRGLYNIVTKTENKNISFSMNLPSLSDDKKYSYLRVLISKTEFGFYSPLLILVMIILNI